MSHRTSLDEAAVAALSRELVDATRKGWPPQTWGRPVADVAEDRLRLSDFPTPLVTLSRSALTHNTEVVAQWAGRHGLALAPHGKTTMAPQLWAEQLAAGAWGITLANFAQLAVARAFGVGRVLVANTLLSPLALRWLAAELTRHPRLRVVTWVDSVDAVQIMTDALTATLTDGFGGPGPTVDVMVELGGLGGRTGARTVEAALAVADAVDASPHLRLVGVAGYEGALAHGSITEASAVVREYLGRLAHLHRSLVEAGRYAGDEPPVVSAGGSAYPDLVAEVLAPLADGGAATVLVRAGAYLTHDDGYYRHVSPWGEHPRTDGDGLHAALHGWVRVSSLPEPGLAIIDAGKRDLPFDEGMPEVQLVRGRTPGAAARAAHGLTVTALNDQHGFVRLDDGATDLQVGDELRLGLSHPCTTFDKWTLIPVVDDADAADPVVVDAVRTFF